MTATVPFAEPRRDWPGASHMIRRSELAGFG